MSPHSKFSTSTRQKMRSYQWDRVASVSLGPQASGRAGRARLSLPVQCLASQTVRSWLPTPEPDNLIRKVQFI